PGRDADGTGDVSHGRRNDLQLGRVCTKGADGAVFFQPARAWRVAGGIAGQGALDAHDRFSRAKPVSAGHPKQTAGAAARVAGEFFAPADRRDEYFERGFLYRCKSAAGYARSESCEWHHDFPGRLSLVSQWCVDWRNWRERRRRGPGRFGFEFRHGEFFGAQCDARGPDYFSRDAIAVCEVSAESVIIIYAR